jgi:hypothetical protein
VIDIPTVPEVVCGPRFVHSDIPPDTGPVWRIVTGAESHNFNYWPPEADDPLPHVEGFDGFA